VVSPLKSKLGEYKLYEEKIVQAIAIRFGIDLGIFVPKEQFRQRTSGVGSRSGMSTEWQFKGAS